MSISYYLQKYKSDIINLLLKNDMFIKLINPTMPEDFPELDVYDVLNGGTWNINGTTHEEQGYIFDYIFANDTTSEEKSFIFVEARINKIDKGTTLADIILYVYVCVNKNLIRLTFDTAPSVSELKQDGYFATTRGNRVDTLCDCIDRVIDRNPEIKGVGFIEPTNDDHITLYLPNNIFYGKCLKYIMRQCDIGGDNCENN